jgi:hypothetical protein
MNRYVGAEQISDSIKDVSKVTFGMADYFLGESRARQRRTRQTALTKDALQPIYTVPDFYRDVAELWLLAIDDSDAALARAVELHNSHDRYEQRVAQDFLDEYKRAQAIALPDDISLNEGWIPWKPTLLQRRLASRIIEKGRSIEHTESSLDGIVFASRTINANLVVIALPGRLIPLDSYIIQQRLPSAGIQWCTKEQMKKQDVKKDGPLYVLLDRDLIYRNDSDATLDRLIGDKAPDFVVGHAVASHPDYLHSLALLQECAKRNPDVKGLLTMSLDEPVWLPRKQW